mmetsp:Transcript_21847/g.43347  ORF Transcript_21847/g.43347 Transcript_21847/m.43347 type:complete len:151 (-) Transcript_21847:82-534(-)|eukprot:CAMPEP_0175141170 /NCGR_PEP_ID=MMETSP0087-20121206/11946_1 /TAXON_ID=136419 /ORGANISM="Unknown Unknown, Strain D1" /LENGTH=150 /DNA_ID=CAMNT_0016424535 /DNA_START=50 /DNA_END=502 /DNA_ORIENTATION=-
MNLALASNGVAINTATSSDEQFPASNVLDGNYKTFWLTTGMYPQEFIIAFPKPIQFKTIKTFTKSVKRISVMRCEKNLPVSFEDVYDNNLEENGNVIQEEAEEFQTAQMARYLKVVIKEGWEEFASVHMVEVRGTVAEGGGGMSMDGAMS